jgi:methylmalonyl-CoA mutase
MFQEIEAAGGVADALAAGWIQQKVAKVRAEREAAVARRQDALTGVSDFANLAEVPVKVLDVKPSIAAPSPAKVTSVPLPRMRLAEPFEALRDKSDDLFAKAKARPKVFLANLGMLADFNARATFAKSFFEAGGIEAVASEGGGDYPKLAAVFKKSGAKLACLCSSDEVYAKEAAEAAKALGAAGAKHIYLAGDHANTRPR